MWGPQRKSVWKSLNWKETADGKRTGKEASDAD